MVVHANTGNVDENLEHKLFTALQHTWNGSRFDVWSIILVSIEWQVSKLEIKIPVLWDLQIVNKNLIKIDILKENLISQSLCQFNGTLSKVLVSDFIFKDFLVCNNYGKSAIDHGFFSKSPNSA